MESRNRNISKSLKLDYNQTSISLLRIHKGWNFEDMLSNLYKMCLLAQTTLYFLKSFHVNRIWGLQCQGVYKEYAEIEPLWVAECHFTKTMLNLCQSVKYNNRLGLLVDLSVSMMMH